mmetsp:Transcript_20943/g.36780  ORF Transcript_20943/g.36780 Transcript_20943/m.36780 type:complete len:213 (-) Transcript_20943:260-898(-)
MIVLLLPIQRALLQSPFHLLALHRALDSALCILLLPPVLRGARTAQIIFQAHQLLIVAAVLLLQLLQSLLISSHLRRLHSPRLALPQLVRVSEGDVRSIRRSRVLCCARLHLRLHLLQLQLLHRFGMRPQRLTDLLLHRQPMHLCSSQGTNFSLQVPASLLLGPLSVLHILGQSPLCFRHLRGQRCDSVVQLPLQGGGDATLHLACRLLMHL